MSNFDLPPLIGFAPGQKPRFSMPSLQDLAKAVQGPGGLEIGKTGPGGTEGVDGTGSTSDFGEVLQNAIGTMRGLQADVNEKTRGLVLGEDVELHDVMMAADKSEVSFNLLLEVRNKLVDAWEKLSRSAV